MHLQPGLPHTWCWRERLPGCSGPSFMSWRLRWRILSSMSCTVSGFFISTIIYMISDMVNLSLIPNDLLQSWAQSAQTHLSTLLQAPNITLGHLEELLEAQARKLMLPILSAASQALAAQQ